MKRAGYDRARLIAALVPVLLLGAGVRLLGLGNQDLWGDEAFSVMTALGSVRALLTSLSSGEPHPPLYPLLLAGWIRAFGHSEMMARLPSAFAGIASIAVAAPLARAFARRGERREMILASVIAGVVVALNPFQVWYAQEARMYAQVSFFAGLSALALLRLWQGRRGAIPLYALSLAGTIGSHYFGLFIPLAHAVAVGVDALDHCATSRSRIARWIKATGLTALLYLPWVIYAQRVFRGYYGAQPGTVDLFQIAASAWVRIAAGWSISWRLAVLAAAIVTILAVLGSLLPTRDASERFARTLLVSWLLIPFLAGFVVSLIRPMYAERYLIVSSLPLLLLMARTPIWLLSVPSHSSPPRGVKMGERRGLTRRLRPLFGAATVLVTIVLAVGPLTNVWAGRYVKSTYNTHVRDVAALIRPGDAVILDGTSQLPLYSYYLPAPWPTYPLPRQLPLDPTVVTAELSRIADQHRGVWVFLYATQDYDPGYLVPRWLTAHAYRTFDDWAVSGRLQFYRFAPDARLTYQETAIKFGGLLSLDRYAWLDAQFDAGDSVPVALSWRAWGTPASRLRVALRLVDDAGFTWAQTDQYIGGDFEAGLPTPQGQPFDDRHGLPIPPGTPPGHYQLRLSVYETGAPQPFEATGSGAAIVPSGLNLATVNVARPSKSFWPDGLAGFRALPASFDGGLDLLGFAGSDQVLAGSSGYLTFVWKASQTHPTADKLRIDLVGADGKTAQSRDLRMATEDFPPARWEKGDVIRTQYRLPVGQRLPPGTYHIQVRPIGDALTSAGQTVGLITVLPGPTPVSAPQPSHALAYRLGEGIDLIGYDLPSTTARAGGPLSLTLYWRDRAPLDRDYTVFVHLLDGASKVVAQQDQQPAAGQRPTSSWFPDDLVVDQYRLDLPADLAAGSYPLEIGLYDATSGARLPVSQNGKPEGDRIILGPVEVVE